MLYYPQLTSGSISQYPLSRINRRRTVRNVLADGSDLRTEDEGADQVTWDLNYTHLTTAEYATIEQLFEAVEGRLGTFTFTDPSDNLLTWSEDFAQSAWTSDPLIQIAGGSDGPVGVKNAVQLTNTAQAAQRLGQTIASPSWFQYCFSAYLRSDVPCTVQLIVSSPSGQLRRAFTAGPSWTRAVSSVLLSGTQDDGVYVGLELPTGCRVIMYGPQIEAQAGAGPYKKTTDLAGIYTNSRFDSDSLTLTTTGPNQHSCSVRIKSCGAG